jgi:hypothetical protein
VETKFSAALSDHLRPGMTVALGDGVGAPRCLDDGTSVCATLSAVARCVGGVRLVLGWLPSPPPGFAAEAFAEVVAIMPGWGVRNVLTSPTARFVPTRLSSVPSLMRGVLRPDVLITRVVNRADGFHFSTEVSWQREIVDAGTAVFAIADANAPHADAGPPLPTEAIAFVARTCDGPVEMPSVVPDAVHEALADAVLRFVPEGARLQYGPGKLGTALLNRTQRPLRIDTGLLTDAVVELDAKGLLIGMPSAAYLLGTDTLYRWADSKPILHGIDYTHDLARLSRGLPLVAVNTALEIDPFGQINVEGIGDKVVGGIGGHPDYCAAASMSRGGLSIIAVPSTANGRSPFVAQLSRPASTPAHDIDVIVTESGHADLRGAGWEQRRRLIGALFE